MSRGLRNNNPGNIRHSLVKYRGEKRSNDSAFKAFNTMAEGYRAMFVLLYTYQKRHKLNTLREMITRYAPPEDNNDTGAYINAVSKWSLVPADVRIDTQTREIMVPIVAAMSRMENGVAAVMEEVREGWELFRVHRP